jgi:hypothetical protein
MPVTAMSPTIISHPLQSHPLQITPIHLRRRIWVCLMTVTLVFALTLRRLDRELRTDRAPAGMISFALSGSPDRARLVLSSWNQRARKAAVISLWIDFAFIPIYSTAFAASCLWARQPDRLRGTNPAETVDEALAWGQWAAGCLDVVENVAMMRQLQGDGRACWPRIARWMALSKFGLLIAGGFYALVISRTRLPRLRP